MPRFRARRQPMLFHLRRALPGLRNARGFALIAITTLAVAIGASTAIYSALRALVIAPFHYPAAERLVQVWSGGERWSLSGADFLDLQEQMSSFAEIGVYTPKSVNVGTTHPRPVVGVTATSGVLRSFGVGPFQGRWLTPADEANGAPPVAVISHALSKQVFGDQNVVVGRTIRIDSAEVRVVGVMPNDFEFAAPWLRTVDCQLWLPLRVERGDPEMARHNHWLCGIARLRDGIPIGTADAEIKAIGRRLAALYPDSNTRKEFLVRSLQDELTRDIGAQLWMLFASAVLMLLIACANVASMLLARGTQRQGEFGVRVALGARGLDLVKLTLADSVVLALCAGVLGLVLAELGTEILRVIAPASGARKSAISLDSPALLFALGCVLVTAVLTGLLPALAALRTNVAMVIRSDARGALGSRSRRRALRGLIVVQIAVAFVLANAAVLFSTSYLRLLDANRNLSTEEVLTARVNLGGRPL